MALKAWGKKAANHHAIHPSKNVLFPGHNHLLTTGADEPILWLPPEHQQVRGHQYQLG